MTEYTGLNFKQGFYYSAIYYYYTIIYNIIILLYIDLQTQCNAQMSPNIMKKYINAIQWGVIYIDNK